MTCCQPSPSLRGASVPFMPSVSRLLARGVDTVLDRTVAPGFTKIGPAVRRRLPTWPADPEPGSLGGRVVLVTGATSGLGLATAEGCARLGAVVHLVVRDVDKGRRVRGEIERAVPGAEVYVDRCDVSDLDDVRRFAADLDLDRLDVLVHNAGNVRRAALAEISHEDFQAVVDVHLFGAFHVVRAAFPVMIAANYGRIVLTSSIGGLYGNHDVANYAAAKAGTIGLANVAALEGEPHGITCNVIVPAAVTRMAEGLDTSAYPPMGPELVAPVVGWLAHESCSISGEMLAAIAGRVARVVVAETPGVYRPQWSIEDVAADIEAIRDISAPMFFPVLPNGHAEHIGYSFAVARDGGAR